MAIRQEANPLLHSDEEGGLPSSIRVIIADSEPIFRVGVRKILALERDVCVVAQVETEASAMEAANQFEADVLLFECGLSDTPYPLISSLIATAPSLKVVLVIAEPTEEETVEFLRRGVRGIVTRSIAPEMLVKCLRKVHAGETWLDNQAVNWVIEAYRTQASRLSSSRQRVKLSAKEIQIIAGVTQGLRNKDIAVDVGTTEQVVKNYLRKIYDKLGVSDRLELALYCMHHRLLDHHPGPGAPMVETNAVGEAAASMSNLWNATRK